MTGRPKHGPGPNRRCVCLESIDHRRPPWPALALQISAHNMLPASQTRNKEEGRHHITQDQARRGEAKREYGQNMRAGGPWSDSDTEQRMGVPGTGLRAFGNKHTRNIGLFWVRLPWWTASAATASAATASAATPSAAEQGRGGGKKDLGHRTAYPTRQLKRRSRLSTTSVQNRTHHQVELEATRATKSSLYLS
jgi:hypothetical protein